MQNTLQLRKIHIDNHLAAFEIRILHPRCQRYRGESFTVEMAFLLSHVLYRDRVFVTDDVADGNLPIRLIAHGVWLLIFVARRLSQVVYLGGDAHGLSIVEQRRSNILGMSFLADAMCLL